MVMEAVCAPVLHAYTLAPEAVRVAEPPAQMVAELTVTTGMGFTKILVTTEEEQPAAEVPVMV